MEVVENDAPAATAAVAESPAMKTVPETLLKKRKRDEQWAINRKEQLESAKGKNSKSRTVIFKRAEQYIREYRGQVSSYSAKHLNFAQFRVSSLIF